MRRLVQLHHATPLTSEADVAQRAWVNASLSTCPRHPRGGCGFARHGTYPRRTPVGTQLARCYCPTAQDTLSLLPDCLASRFPSDLDDLEHVVLHVEGARSIEAAADVLRANGVNVQAAHGANSMDKRDAAIQTLARYRRRLVASGAAFEVNPRFVVVSKGGSQITPALVHGLEAGCVWDTRSTSGAVNPNTRRPLKDGVYAHSRNCVEYIALRCGPTAPAQKQTRLVEESEWPACNPMGENSWRQ